MSVRHLQWKNFTRDKLINRTLMASEKQIAVKKMPSIDDIRRNNEFLLSTSGMTVKIL